MRATVRGSYRQEGVLIIREGARLQCNAPGCLFTIRNIRALVMKASSSILAERVVVEVPQVNISGIIQGNLVNIVAATLNIGSEGVLLSSDRSNTTASVVINVSPSNLIQARTQKTACIFARCHRCFIVSFMFTASGPELPSHKPSRPCSLHVSTPPSRFFQAPKSLPSPCSRSSSPMVAIPHVLTAIR